MQDLLLSYYGDDFTGSTDVMEVLTWAGLPTVLFTRTPGEAELRRFPAVRAIGVAGESRSCSTEWMSANLPEIFERLRSLGAPLCQYKVCSTFDSSPEVGSIGRALEIGLEVFGGAWAPIVVAAPKLGRYQAFGNLFATVGSETFRLDRHPTMSRHPITPMDEADLGAHLARQTKLPVGVVDLLALASGQAGQRLDEQTSAGARAVLMDVIDEESLGRVGELVWKNRSSAPFSVASSGLEYALAAHWRALGDLGAPTDPPRASEVDRVVVISGSCSPETEASIRQSLASGYAGIRLDPFETAAGRTAAPLSQARQSLADGRSVVLYTSLGPNDQALVAGDRELTKRLGVCVGELARDLLLQSSARRAIVCGGDTSSHVGRALDGYALTAIAPMTPGSPLCRLWSDGPLDGLEIVLKGGQRGGPHFFEQVRMGDTS